MSDDDAARDSHPYRGSVPPERWVPPPAGCDEDLRLAGRVIAVAMILVILLACVAPTCATD